MRVLIAADGLSPEVASARAAAARPWPAESSFCLLNVLDPYPFNRTPLFLDRAKERVLQNLDSAAGSLRQAGWNTTTEVYLGSPRRGINQFARDWKSDLVVVGCNEVSDLTRLVLGSTAQSVVRHGPCSVEVVRPHSSNGDSARGRGMKILVATDGSEFSLAALCSVANRPWPAGSIVKVISVPEFVLVTDSSYLQTHEVRELGMAAIEEAKISVAAGVGALSKSGLKIFSEIPTIEDRPYRVILKQSQTWPADMIVVGSHGRTGFDRIVMGSVAEAVALHAKCSVEVIREQKSKG